MLWEALAYAWCKRCHPERAMPHTEQLQPHRVRHRSPKGLEPGQGWPAGIWSWTHLANAICKLTWNSVWSHALYLAFTTGQEHACSLFRSPGNTQELSTWQWRSQAAETLTWWHLGMIEFLCMIPTSAGLRAGRDKLSHALQHPTVVMFMAIIFLPAFLDVPNEEM